MIRRVRPINAFFRSIAGLLHMRVHRRLTEGDISLRPVRIFDAPFLHSGFISDDFLAASGLSRPVTSSQLLTWWWIKKRFAFSYCILIDGKLAGFLGLHSLQPCAAAEISLALFEKKIRRKGLGSRAFRLFADDLEKYDLIKKIVVRVAGDNLIYLSFWQKLGFREINREDRVITLLYSKKQRVVE